MAFAVFSVYMWFAFFSPEKPPYAIQLATVLTASAAAAAAIFARISTEAKGIFARSVTAYLLLIAAIALLMYDTNGIASPYIFMWTLAAAFAGLFGAWSAVPVFLIATGYLAMLIINKELAGQAMVPTLLITTVPVIFSIIVWSHVRKTSELKKERDPVAYKQVSSEITNLGESEVIINAIGDGVLAIDSQGIIQLMNPAAQTILGWSKHDALSLQYESVLKITGEDDKPLADVKEPVKQALNTNQEIRNSRLKLETKGGKKIYLSLIASPLGDAGSGVIVVLRDITKERAEEREQAEFISTASHEMRTPVASIEGYLGLALNPATAAIDDKARDFITKAHESAQHLGRLFQDLLDVSKAEDGRLSNIPVVLDIVEYAGSVVEGLQPKAQEKGLQLVFKPQASSAQSERGERRLSPVFYVNLDKDHVREVINNLTENAIKYTPQGEVSIDITGDDEHVTVAITDSGIGIPAEDIPHLFQKFYRVDNSDTREIGGTGLGLYLCRRLVETMGGRLWVESVYKQGSTFFVQLPRIDTQRARQLQEQQAAQQASSTPAPSAEPAATFTPESVAPVVSPQSQGAPTPPPVTAAPQPTPVQPAAITPSAANAQPPAAAPAAPLQPTAAPTPIPVTYTPSPAPQAPTAYYPTVVGGAPQVNTPLSSIEQNPAAYTQARTAGVPVPPRPPQSS